jgi:hypothetical protein
MNTIKVLGSPLYQWEIGRKIQIIPVGGLRISVVHFSAVGDVNALVVEPKTENGRIIADIPNILLQTGRNIVVYVVDVSEAGIETLRDCVLAVRGRAKPADYVYTETEVRTWGQLAQEIARLKESPASGEQIGQAVADYMAKNPIANGIPAGGKAGQYLCKQSDTDYDVVWADIPEQYGLVTYDQNKTITIT